MRFQRRPGTLLTTVVALAACGSPEADIPAEEDVPVEEVRTTIRESIRTEDDALRLVDPRSGEPLQLAFNYVHEGVSETPGGRYVACVDFLGPDGTAYDVDYYVARGAEEFRVEDVVFHKAGEATVLADSIRARPEAQFYEPGEVWQLLEAAREYDASRPGSFLDPILTTFAYTGGRQAEVLGLEIEDVDFDSVVVKGVKGAIQFRPNQWRGLKTWGSERTVPLWPDLREMLRSFVGERTIGLLFPSDRGSMRRDLRKALDQIGKLAGFPKGYVRTKPFRHTYGSMRIQTVDSGEPVAIYTVSRELGHRDTKMVEQTYGHLLNQRHRRSVVSYKPDTDGGNRPDLSVVA